MTTIAYDTKTLVSDSRSCIGSMIYEEDCQKLFPDVGPFVIVGIAGVYQDAMDIIECISPFTTLQQVRQVDYKANGWDALIMGITYEGSIWYYVGDDSFELSPDKPYAVGSGASYAISAMDLGKSAEEAVKYASTRDMHTNDTVQVATIIEIGEGGTQLQELSIPGDTPPETEQTH